MRGKKILNFSIIAISFTVLMLAFVAVTPAYAPPPTLVEQVLCRTNNGWTSSPDVLIITTNAPSIGSTSAVEFVKDAISDYWNEGADVDGEDENGANSDFVNTKFGIVSTGTSGIDDITITFGSLSSGVLGVASCIVDTSTREITSASITLTTTVTGFNDEDYKNLAAHELGHVIGITSHSGPPGTLMFPFSISGQNAYFPLSPHSQIVLTNLYG